MKNEFREFPEACELALELPIPNEPVLVIGRDYKTVGYVDRKDVWRQRGNGSKLHDVVDWQPLK